MENPREELRKSTCIGLVYECWKHHYDPTEPECQECPYKHHCELFSRLIMLIITDEEVRKRINMIIQKMSTQILELSIP